MHNMKNVIGGDDSKKRSSGPDLVSGRDSRSFLRDGPSLCAMHRFYLCMVSITIMSMADPGCGERGGGGCPSTQVKHVVGV